METVCLGKKKSLFKAFLYCSWIFFLFLFDIFIIIPTWSKMAHQRALTKIFFQRRRLFHHSAPKIVFASWQGDPVFYFLIQRTRSSALSAGFQGKPTSVLQHCYTPLRRHPACSHSSCRPQQRCPHDNQPSVATAPGRRSVEQHQQPPRCGESKRRFRIQRNKNAEESKPVTAKREKAWVADARIIWSVAQTAGSLW